MRDLNWDARNLLERLSLRPAPPISTLPLDEARSMFKKMAVRAAPPSEAVFNVVSENCVVEGGSVPVRFYIPIDEPIESGPLIVFIHGGGWVFGDLDDFDPFCRSLAVRSNCRVASVGYRLAPEHPFPVGIQDVRSVLIWLVSKAKEFSVDISRIGLVGDSAGGNLAAAVCQLGFTVKPRALALIYPCTDLTMSNPSHNEFADGFLLTRASLLWFRKQYLPANVEPSDPRVSPLHGPVISGLRDALVITAGYDPLRDEGRALAEKLRAEHVRVQYECYESMIHGFITMGGQIPAAEEAVWQVALWIKDKLME
jgi:acetyl esterase